MVKTDERIKRLATREHPSQGAVVARQGLRSRQARPGRHQATVSKLSIATWNIRSLGVSSDLGCSLPRKSAVIDAELSRLNIQVAALSETWLTGNGSIKEANFSFYWTGYDDGCKPMHGVGFAIHNSLMRSVEKPVGHSPRLMTLRMQTDCGLVTFLSAYAPTLDADEDVKAQFYDQLSVLISKVPRTERLVLLGDLNARVGSCSTAWPGVLGSHGVGVMNDNGQRFLELCTLHQLCLPGTFFQGSTRSKVTWCHPRSKRWHQLDHVAVKRAHLKEVTHCRTLHSADCDSDHSLVRCKLRLVPERLHHNQPKPGPRLNTAAMGDPVLKQSFVDLLKESLDSSALAASEDPSSAWETFHKNVTNAASSAFGKKSRNQPDWFKAHAEKLLPVLAAKREARLHYLSDSNEASLAHLRLMRNNVQHATRMAMHEYWSDLCSRIEGHSASGNIRGVFEGLKEALGPVPKKSAPLRSTSGAVLTDLDAQLHRWVEHYSSLYAQPVIADARAIESAVPELPVLEELDAALSLEEVNRAVHVLKNNKASGADGLPPELFKAGGDTLAKALLHVLLSCWDAGQIPSNLKDANIITLYKNKGDRSDCNNYRGISLLSLAGKILARVILPRLQTLAERILPESQCGFRASRSTVDMVFCVRQLQEKCIEQSKPLYMVFVDLTKAFDYVSRSGLFMVLNRLGCPPKLLSIIKELHYNMKATVQFDGSRSNEFPIECGVKQGCVLAPTLFGIFFSALLRRAFPENSGVLLHSRSTGKLFNLARLRAKSKVRQVLIRELLYADDAALAAHSEADLQALCTAFASACKEFGMTISLKKTVVMAQPTSLSPSIFIDGTKLEVVDKFTYLGSTVTSSASLDAELDIRIGKASTTFGRLTKRVWKNSKLSLHLKIRVYHACILSILLYASESWVTYRKQEHRLNAFHFRCLRSILGVCWSDRVPNSVVLERTGSVDLYTLLRSRRLRWTGHVCRMDDARYPKALLYGELANAPRRRGRPRLRFKDVVKRDLVAFDIDTNCWELTACDREQWRSALKSGCHTSSKDYLSFLDRRRLNRHANRRPRLNGP